MQPRQPDVSLGPLTLWVERRQFPNSGDYWDANWLVATAVCRDSGAHVEVTGPIIHAPELVEWAQSLEALAASLQGVAVLETMEPSLKVHVRVATVSRAELEVTITPNPSTQEHRFRREIDPSHLAAALSGVRAVLSRFPIVGAP